MESKHGTRKKGKRKALYGVDRDGV